MYLRHYKYDAEYLMEEASERERDTDRQCVQYGPVWNSQQKLKNK